MIYVAELDRQVLDDHVHTVHFHIRLPILVVLVPERAFGASVRVRTCVRVSNRGLQASDLRRQDANREWGVRWEGAVEVVGVGV